MPIVISIHHNAWIREQHVHKTVLVFSVLSRSFSLTLPQVDPLTLWWHYRNQTQSTKDPPYTFDGWVQIQKKTIINQIMTLNISHSNQMIILFVDFFSSATKQGRIVIELSFCSSSFNGCTPLCFSKRNVVFCWHHPPPLKQLTSIIFVSS